MFNTRADVDRHVENCLKKINTESEVRDNFLTAITPAYELHFVILFCYLYIMLLDFTPLRLFKFMMN